MLLFYVWSYLHLFHCQNATAFPMVIKIKILVIIVRHNHVNYEVRPVLDSCFLLKFFSVFRRASVVTFSQANFKGLVTTTFGRRMVSVSLQLNTFTFSLFWQTFILTEIWADQGVSHTLE